MPSHASTAAFYLRRIVHLAVVINGTPADHALCGMYLQYGAIDTTADTTCPDCSRIAERLASATPAVDSEVETLLDEVEARAEQQHAEDEADREANAVGCDCPAAPGPHAVHCDDCSAPVDACVCEPTVDDDPREQPVPLEWSEHAEVRA